jgi:hypothetical protein
VIFSAEGCVNEPEIVANALRGGFGLHFEHHFSRRAVTEKVSLRDLPATIVDLAGLADGSPLPGRSLARFWGGSGETRIRGPLAFGSGRPLPSPRNRPVLPAAGRRRHPELHAEFSYQVIGAGPASAAVLSWSGGRRSMKVYDEMCVMESEY